MGRGEHEPMPMFCRFVYSCATKRTLWPMTWPFWSVSFCVGRRSGPRASGGEQARAKVAKGHWRGGRQAMAAVTQLPCGPEQMVRKDAARPATHAREFAASHRWRRRARGKIDQVVWSRRRLRQAWHGTRRGRGEEIAILDETCVARSKSCASPCRRGDRRPCRRRSQ